MRKLFFSMAVMTAAHLATAQCTNDFVISPLTFTGTAPAPWAIDGSVNDWTSLFGAAGTNPSIPYPSAFMSAGNYSRDQDIDLDAPNPNTDARFSAFTFDSKNVYLYLRRLNNGGPQPSYYFFIDLNFDGHMNTGEPVVGGRFAGASPVSLFKYVPAAAGNVPGMGNRMMDQDDPEPFTGSLTAKVDGYDMPGTVQRVFSSNAIPSAYSLEPGEVFAQEVTEDGYGVELAIPWRFLRNWQSGGTALAAGSIFLFRATLQQGPSNANFQYNPSAPNDNMGSCCSRLMFTGIPSLSRTFTQAYNAAQRKLTIQTTITNNTNVTEYIRLSYVGFPRINGSPSDPGSFNGTDLQVTVNGSALFYTPSAIVGYDGPARQLVAPGGSLNYTIEITIPAGSPVSSYQVEVNNDPPFFAYFGYRCARPFQGLGGGGVNPIILDVTTESRNRFIQPGAETQQTGGDLLKVFPNPARGLVNVVIPGIAGNGEIRIEDMSGKLIHRQMNNGAYIVTINGLRSGMYVVRFIASDGKQYRSKLVVD